MDVHLLWHTHEHPDGDEDVKLIGVYATSVDAEAARLRVLDQPGFRDAPDGFEIVRYEVGKDEWTEGYFGTVEADAAFRLESDPPSDPPQFPDD